MRSFIIFISLLFVSSSLALPFPLEEGHYLRSVPKRSLLEKRDAVCGQDFRFLVTKESCNGKTSAFVLSSPTDSTVTSKAVPPVPDDVQCDHLVELQLLNSVAQNSGLCSVITALEAADSGTTKANVLNDAAQHISALQNLNFLQDKVNNQKKTVIQRALSKTGKQGTKTLDGAVKDYLTKTASDGKAVAATIDGDIATIISHAQKVLSGLPDGKGGAKSRDPKDVVKRNLTDALANYEKNKAITVAATFQSVLTKASAITVSA